jgi:predicted site-specific integrase-resolvase
MSFLPASKLAHYGISASSLRRHADNGTIKHARFKGGGKRLYEINSVLSFLRLDQQEVKEKKAYIYCRVSSTKQKGDLDRQCADLKQLYPHHIVVKDIASGLNYKRRGLKALLDKCLRGVVSEVVVMHKDRLARYGVEIFEFLFEKTGVKFVVHRKSAPSDEDELAQDLLAITTVFCARHHGRRAAENRRKRRRQQDRVEDSIEAFLQTTEEA